MILFSQNNSSQNQKEQTFIFFQFIFYISCSKKSIFAEQNFLLT